MWICIRGQIAVNEHEDLKVYRKALEEKKNQQKNQQQTPELNSAVQFVWF